MTRESTSWLLWQLADASFPSGGFAHSGGVEAAWKQMLVRDEATLHAFVRIGLIQTGRQSLPIALTVHAQPDRFIEADAFCDATLLNHVANRASRLQGRAMLTACARAFTHISFDLIERPCVEGASPGHLAPVWGGVTRLLDLSETESARLLLFTLVRGQLSAAIRLGIVGPLRAQALLHALAPLAEQAVARAAGTTLDDTASVAPLADLLQNNQDRLYSRLFQS